MSRVRVLEVKVQGLEEAVSRLQQELEFHRLHGHKEAGK